MPYYPNNMLGYVEFLTFLKFQPVTTQNYLSDQLVHLL